MEKVDTLFFEHKKSPDLQGIILFRG